MVATLLADGSADPSTCDGLTAAARAGHVEVVRLLLADPRVRLDNATLFFEAFNAAASNGRVGVIACFLADPRVDPTAHSWAGYNALTWAIKAGNVAVVDLLLQDSRVCPVKDANEARRSIRERRGPAYDFSHAMLEAAERGHLAVLQRLVADPRMGLLPPRHLSEWCSNDVHTPNTLLSMAVRHGHTETVDWLLSHPSIIDPSVYNCIALRAAADTAGEIALPLARRWRAEAQLRGEQWTWEEEQELHRPRAYAEGERIRVAIAEKLLADPRVDPSVNDDAPLAEAAYAPNRTMFFRLLADPRVNLANPRRPMAVYAAGGGDVAILQHVLADPRVDPGKSDLDGDSALALAASRDRVAATELLLADPRVDPAAQDNLAIRVAGKRASLELIEMMLSDPRVDASARNNEALKKAVEKQPISVAARLLAVPAVARSLNTLRKDTVEELIRELKRFRLRVPAALQAVAQQMGLAPST